MYPGRSFSFFDRLFLLVCLILTATCLRAQDVWSKPAFSVEPENLRRAAAAIGADKDAETTILLSEVEITFDAAGKMVKKTHMIYRIERQDGVENWSEVRANWEPWYQSKPEIKARVITSDGVVHWLDPKTLNDLPVHDNQPDVYSDERAYGGPLPALAPAAIGEEETITRDTAPFFSGGTFERYFFKRGAPVNKTRFVISHPESLPLHYVLHLAPDAFVNKSTNNGIETIVIEKGPLDASTEARLYAPSDAVLSPMLEYATGSSWQQMAAEYSRQINDKLRVADVQPIVSQLDLKAGANLEAIRKIVAVLHKNVRYTGVEFGESNLIPQFPNETLKRKYGDCKDKAALLATMLRAAGIPASLALLSAGPGQDINPELPGMGGFDHAIVYVPATSSSPELWIDATAQYSLVGNLPTMDYGRWALIADEKTTALKKIPELTADKNRHVETREFILADYGPAAIVEKNEQIGPSDADYRDYYSGDSKKIRDNSEKYFKDAYLADSLTSMEKTDPADLDKPFVIAFSAKGRRGFTEIDSASVYIPQSGIFSGLPEYFYAKEGETDKDEPEESKPKQRTVDWAITPFVTEWHYKISAPAGFKIRTLPPNKDEQLGSTHYNQKYSANQDGTVVEAVLRFDSGKARFTAEEGRKVRDAIVKARSADGISIAFEQIGYSLLSEGKIKEALAIDRRLAADHPKEALHRVRLARALLTAGLGEKARAVIKEAVALDPKSAQAFGQQGWILEHDLIGRLRKKGFDYEGAIAAYRKAKQLDPKDKATRGTLAMLLEYDADGERYGKKAHLEEAVAEFNELKKMDVDFMRSYPDFVPYDLWYLGKCKELNDYIAGLPKNEARRSLTLACTATTDSTEAAIKKSLEITSNEEERSKALSGAGWFLLQVRKYSEAAELLAAGARGQNNESQIAPLAARLRKTKRFEDLKIDSASPISVIQAHFGVLFSESVTEDKIGALMTRQVRQSSGFKAENGKKEIARAISSMRAVAQKSGMRLESLGDIAISNAHYSIQGDDSLGYKIAVETPGAPANDAFIVREDGQYKLVDFSLPGKVPEGVGWEVLARWQKKDLAGARKWLDWAREKVHISRGDDPLSGQPFPRFWTKGQEGDENAIHVAALVLLPSEDLKGEDLAALVEARNQAATEAVRADINVVLARAYFAQKRWTELRAVAAELMKAAPDSLVAFMFASGADAGLRQLDDWERLIKIQQQKHPDEPEYIRSAIQLARYRGAFGSARELLKGLIDRGKSTSDDLNSYAWDALYIPGGVDQDAIDAAHRASELTNNSNFNILHTLACLYAATGKTKEARELLVKAMEEAGMDEPDSAVWLAQAGIAEQYGETDAARTMYSRVEKPEMDYPSSNYALAQIHLAALQNGAVTAKAAGQ